MKEKFLIGSSEQMVAGLQISYNEETIFLVFVIYIYAAQMLNSTSQFFFLELSNREYFHNGKQWLSSMRRKEIESH